MTLPLTRRSEEWESIWYLDVHSRATRDLRIMGRVTYAIDGEPFEAWVSGSDLYDREQT